MFSVASLHLAFHHFGTQGCSRVDNDLLAELSFVILAIHLCNGLNDKNLVKTEENVFSYCLTVSCVT